MEMELKIKVFEVLCFDGLLNFATVNQKLFFQKGVFKEIGHEFTSSTWISFFLL